MSGPSRESGLGDRAPLVFERHLGGHAQDLHPEDRAEADAFVRWLGGFAPPAVAEATPWQSAWATRIAAVTAVAAMIIGVWVMLPLRTAQSAEAFVTYAAGHAENRRVTLSDGSLVDLSAESRVDVAFTPGERRLILRSGEALFQVAHNPARPFIVSAANGEVRALGTAFNVRVSARSAEVAIVEGVVRVEASDGSASANHRQAIVRAGQQVDYGSTAQNGRSVTYMSAPQSVEIDDVTAWQRGRLVFRGTPLSEVIAVANRYAAKPIRLNDPSKASMPVFGIFKLGETSEIQALADR